MWWYFSTVLFAFPETCINQNMNGIQIVRFKYILLLYPLLLVFVTYICIELHGHNCILVVNLWRSLNKWFAKLRKNMSANDSIIQDSVLTYISLILLDMANVYRKVTTRVLVYNSIVESFSQEHLP